MSTSGRYRHVVVQRFGEPLVMQIVDDDLHPLGRGQARVRILAADVSFSDVNIRRGRYPGGPKPPFTPGYAMVGTVEEVPAGISSPAVGQMVAALTFYGSYSQYISLPMQELVPLPAGLDPAESVALVLNYVAAHQMLHRVARVRSDQQILVHGGAGGVGTAFLELARLVGARTYATASRPKHDLVKRLGAIPIDYKTEDFVTRIDDLTDGHGVDAVFDPLGSEHLRQSVKVVRRSGSLVAYGFYEAARRGRSPVLDVLAQYLWLTLWSLPPQRRHVTFYDIRTEKGRHPDWFREDLIALGELLAAGRIKPVINSRLGFDDLVQAHAQIERAEVQGKLILVPNAWEGPGTSL